MVLVNSSLDEFSNEKFAPVEIDFLLIHGNPQPNITNLFQFYKPHKIIFDASNSKWKIKKWKQEFQKLNIPTYDINEKGALEISF